MSVWPRREPALFRRMTRDDLASVMNIERRGYQFGWTRGIFEDCLRIGYQSWVLIDSDLLVAYGVMSFAPDEAHILNICVDPDFQDQGYGRGVMDHLIRVAIEHSAKKMWLEVRPSNQAALRLYRRLDFEQAGRRRAYYPEDNGREDALVLTRRLDAMLPWCR